MSNLVKDNVKIVYQRNGDSIVAITYLGNNIEDIAEWEPWQWSNLPDNIKYAFGLHDDQYDIVEEMWYD